MDTLVNALRDTPIPTILVAAGVFFLVLAIAEQIAGKVVIDPSRRRQATITGLVLLALGVLLQFVPVPSRLPPQSPATGSPSAVGGTSGAIATKSPESGQEPTSSGGSRPAPTAGAALNDSIGNAKSIAIGEAVHEAHKSATDRRYFKFSVPDPPPEKVRVLLRDLSRSVMTYPELTVFDKSETEIYRNYALSGNLLFTFAPKAGETYFILASQENPRLSEFADYDIVVTSE